MSRNHAPILVTGATGTHGGSGLAVVEELLRLGRPVRALVRRIDHRAHPLAEMGAEVVVGDYSDYGSLLSALDGVERAYFCYPVGSGIAEAAGLFATAGRHRGLARIVDLSLGSTRPDHPSPAIQAQWTAEQIFEWAGFTGTHLRIAAFFMENILRVDAPGIRAHRMIGNPFGDLPLAWISARDVGAMAAHLLARDDEADRIVTAGGAETMAYPDIADIVSNAIGEPVRYAELTSDQWRAALVAGIEASGTGDVRGVDHLVAQAIALRVSPPLPATDHVRQIAGREPIAFTEFLKAHHAALL